MAETTITHHEAYKDLDKETVGKLVYLSGEIGDANRRTGEQFFELCKLVAEAHCLLASKDREKLFVPWIEHIGISERSAYNYVYVADRFKSVKHIGSFEPMAMITLAQPKVDDAVFNDAVKAAKKSPMDGKEAKEFVVSATVAEGIPHENKGMRKKSELAYVDVPERQPGEDDEELPEPTTVDKKDQVAKLKSVIKQHNAAMMRAVDDLQSVEPRKPIHDKIHQYFRAIHEAVEAWK